MDSNGHRRGMGPIAHAGITVRAVLVAAAVLALLPAAALAATGYGTQLENQSYGGPGTANGQFGSVFGADAVAYDTATGNSYVVDMDNARVEEFDVNHIYLGQLGCASGPCAAGSGSGQFALSDSQVNSAIPGPTGVAIEDGSGDVWVADPGNNRVEVFNASNQYLYQLGCSSGRCQVGSGAGQFDQPTGVAIDQTTGDVFVVDAYNDRIEVFSRTGAYLSQFSTPNPLALAVTPPPYSEVYVTAGGFGCTISAYTESGTSVTQWGACGQGNGDFEGPTGIATDPFTGDVYVVDLSNRVEVFTASGQYLTQFGCASGACQAGQLPGELDTDIRSGIAFAGFGFEVSDSKNYRVQIFGLVSVSVSVAHPVITGDGKTSMQVTAQVKLGITGDTGQHVAFTASDPGVRIGGVSDDGEGDYSATLTSSTVRGETVTLTATDSSLDPSVAGTTTFQQVGVQKIAFTLRPSTVAADGRSSVLGIAHVTSGFKPVAGADVEYASAGDNYIGPVGGLSGRDPASGLPAGEYEAEVFSSPDQPGKVVISASDYSVWQDGGFPTAHATLNQVLPHVAVTLKPTSLKADGTSTTVATVKLTVGSAPVTAGDTVAIASSDPGQTIGSVVYQGKGVYTATITSSRTAGKATITATDTSAAAPDHGSTTLTQTASAG